MSIKNGFSLVEVLIVVAVLAILATIAYPSYQDHARRGVRSQAQPFMLTIASRAEQFYQDNRRYDGGGLGGCGATAPASRYVTYACVPGAAPAQTYTATATGVVGEGMGGFTYTVNEANARASTITTTGWTGNATCWITRKGGSC